MQLFCVRRIIQYYVSTDKVSKQATCVFAALSTSRRGWWKWAYTRRQGQRLDRLNWCFVRRAGCSITSPQSIEWSINSTGTVELTDSNEFHLVPTYIKRAELAYVVLSVNVLPYFIRRTSSLQWKKIKLDIFVYFGYRFLNCSGNFTNVRFYILH